MAFGWDDAIMLGLASAGALSKKPDKYDAKAARRINDRYMGQRPGGYLSPEDAAMAERTRSKGVSSARRSGQMLRDFATRQASARRLSGASAAALTTEANNAEASGREAAYGAATDQELGLFGVNRDFERNKMMTAWGNEIGAAQRGAEQGAAREATLWNSIIGTAPIIADAWNKVPTATTAATNIAKTVAGGAVTTPVADYGIRAPSYNPGAVPPMSR